MLVLRSLSPFNSVWDPTMGMMLPLLRWLFSPQPNVDNLSYRGYPDLDSFSQAGSEAYFFGDPRSCQVDNINCHTCCCGLGLAQLMESLLDIHKVQSLIPSATKRKQSKNSEAQDLRATPVRKTWKFVKTQSVD